MELQSNMKRLRKAKGLSLQKAADLIGIHKTHLFYIETGKSLNPTLSTLLGISEAFDVTLDELLYEKELLKNTDTI